MQPRCNRCCPPPDRMRWITGTERGGAGCSTADRTGGRPAPDRCRRCPARRSASWPTRCPGGTSAGWSRQASVFPNAEKTNMVLRLLAAAGAAGVETGADVHRRRWASPVASLRAQRQAPRRRRPLAAAGVRAAGRRSPARATDTRTLVRAMRERGAAVIVVLGGDGTVRAAAADERGRRPAPAVHRHQQRLPGDVGGHRGRHRGRRCWPPGGWPPTRPATGPRC